ncbi:hypothetical protein A4X13_0g4886 [Tilletia indica]|uniref:ATP-dependent DNA helicase n=1 Tax=Tilletia indica TaxID=43049 RepID=A0A177TVQ8_9BASI|nr:hypothetical protein A4X13_0g4886 [Tilletia indica]
MNFPPVRRAPQLILRNWNPPVASRSSQDEGTSRARHSRRSRSAPFSGSPSEDEDKEEEKEGREVEQQEVEEVQGAVIDEERGKYGTPPVDEVAFANPQPPAAPVTATIFQPSEQRRAVSMAERSKSLFVTGPAGSEKTYALVMIKKLLLDKHGTKMGRVATVAATNNAALCCDGETYHSYFGFSPNDIDLDTVYQRTSRNRVKLLSLQVLLIDEVSQFSKKIFQLLSNLLAKIKRKPEPFDGIQVICFGDFLQLPPPPDTIEGRQAEYAFDSIAWTL